MGIKAGSGKGSSDVGGKKAEVPGVGGSGRRSKKPMQLPPPPPKKPLPPAEGTSPERKDFRLGQYRILEERADYLLCTGYDPNAKYPATEVTPTAFRTGVLMKVAKPPALQQTPWAAGPVIIGGVSYTFEYTGLGQRTARWTDSEGNDQEEEQGIGIPYVVDGVGDIIVAVQIKKNAAVDGMEFTDELGARLRWMDLNVSGRHWAAASARLTVIRFKITSGHGASVLATVQGSGCGSSVNGTVTVYDATGCFFNESAADLVDRKGYAIAMRSGEDCVYECFSLCCP